MTMMINNASSRAAAMAAKANLNKLKKRQVARFEEDTKKFGGIAAMMRHVVERNAPISECFYKGKAAGQYYAWLESNLVFEVARYLADLEVPALTVHDEFIVPEDMADAGWSADIPSLWMKIFTLLINSTKFPAYTPNL